MIKHAILQLNSRNYDSVVIICNLSSEKLVIQVLRCLTGALLFVMTNLCVWWPASVCGDHSSVCGDQSLCVVTTLLCVVTTLLCVVTTLLYVVTTLLCVMTSLCVWWSLFCVWWPASVCDDQSLCVVTSRSLFVTDYLWVFNTSLCCHHFCVWWTVLHVWYSSWVCVCVWWPRMNSLIHVCHYFNLILSLVVQFVNISDEIE